MQDINALIVELDTRMRQDCRSLRKWRHFHRYTAVLLTIVLILAPSLLAVGLISSQSLAGKILLMAIAVVGGLSATFRPYTHSYKRRADMNAVYRLRDEFRAEVAKAEASGQIAIIEVYQKYSQIYSSIYELRGKELLEATLSVTEQREIAGKDSEEESPPTSRRFQSVAD